MLYTFDQLVAKLRLGVIQWHELDLLRSMVERRYRLGVIDPLTFVELDTMMGNYKREHYPQEKWT